MLMPRWILVGAVITCAVLGTANTAVAGSGSNSTKACPGGVCVEVGTPSRPGSSGNGEPGGNNGGSNDPGSSDPDTTVCSYTPVTPSADTLAGMGGQPEGEGGWYFKACSYGDGSTGFNTGGLVWLGQPPPPPDPAVLARQARSRLTFPPVVIAVNPQTETWVHLPVWLAIPNGWQPQSATASVPGMSVTATARPEKVTFDMGDGTSVVCTGPGTVYRPGVHDPESSSPDCGTTYRTPAESYRITATVSWSVTWAGGGESGTLEGLSSSGSTTMRVAESQAVITG
ncbi:hypothetical protein AB0368_06590 [Actinoplanes sp. NPDC051475]|uniref:hypothetical protein n=1 Tax=Actinoplanes sp. NPDC051475 TaxID=3157225 RepID=UPI003450C41C